VSNNRVRNRIRKRSRLAIRQEAADRGIAPGRPYLTWLALMRVHGLTMDEAKARMDEWDLERE
jgi:hypothetical protein